MFVLAAPDRDAANLPQGRREWGRLGRLACAPHSALSLLSVLVPAGRSRKASWDQRSLDIKAPARRTQFYCDHAPGVAGGPLVCAKARGSSESQGKASVLYVNGCFWWPQVPNTWPSSPVQPKLDVRPRTAPPSPSGDSSAGLCFSWAPTEITWAACPTERGPTCRESASAGLGGRTPCQPPVRR